MLALSIRQPYAELILRGVKTVEYRSRPTRKIGERFAIYAARTWAGFPVDVTTGTGAGKPCTGYPQVGVKAPADLVEGEVMKAPLPGLPPSNWRKGQLPTGVLVGSAIIRDCIYKDGWWHWRLAGVRRYRRPRGLPAGSRPQPVWFRAA